MNILVPAAGRVSVLIFKNIPDKIMVLVVGRKVIMAASVDADKGYHPGIYLLQGFAVTDRDEHVFSAMNNVGMALYFRYPEIGA